MLARLHLLTVPAEWRVNHMARIALIICCCGLSAMALQVLNLLLFTADQGWVILLSCGFLAPALSWLAMKCSVSKPHLFEVSELLFWCSTNMAMNGVALFAEDIIFRHKTLMATLFMTLLVPVMLGMRLQLYAALIVWASLLNATTPWLMSQWHSEQIPVYAYVSVFIASGGSFGICCLQNRLLRALYDAESELSFEKQAFESLTSMMCDATCWLASDKETIIACDSNFDTTFGEEMKGKSVSAHIASEEDCLRLTQTLALSHGSEQSFTPVALLPITIKRKSGVPLRVDLYIVRHYIHHKKALSEDAPKERQFFLGVRIQHCIDFPHEPAPAPSDVADDMSGALSRPSEDDNSCAPDQGETRDRNSSACDSVSLPRTTVTGRIFRSVGNARDLRSSLSDLRTLVKREHWFIPPADIRLMPDHLLGEGGYGSVVKGKFYGASVAVKLPSVAVNDSKALKVLSNELRVLRHASHPNLVTCFGAVIDTDANRIAVVFELVCGASLHIFKFIDDSTEGSLQRLQVITGVANALSYLHSRKPVIVHGDLKPDNILIEERGAFLHAKLLDFGLSRLLTSDVQAMGGTLPWMAPEVARSKGANPKASADVFSFGYVLYYITTGKYPFEGFARQEIQRCHRLDNLAPLSWQLNSRFNTSSKRLAELCLQPLASRADINAITDTISKWWSHGILDFEGSSRAKDLRLMSCGGERQWSEALEVLNPRHGNQQNNLPISQAGNSRPPSSPEIPIHAKMLSLINMVKHWNVRQSSCCSFHDAVASVQAACWQMERMSCSSCFDTVAATLAHGCTQCPQCGWLIDETTQEVPARCLLCHTRLLQQL
eukprot:TRINITY_DN20638_c0_g1_i1.p1 TRINITY_DN20638_c0_g1~~TRINITY_DN20638_c0_g1_i1.p1  ORF type:complete len:834 (-),score=80.04 TRINITY_DN20638_c0_g1_i1:306-2807(-)